MYSWLDGGANGACWGMVHIASYFGVSIDLHNVGNKSFSSHFQSDVISSIVSATDTTDNKYNEGHMDPKEERACNSNNTNGKINSNIHVHVIYKKCDFCNIHVQLVYINNKSLYSTYDKK